MEGLPGGWVALMVFILGASVGSFVGVIAYRVPRDQSIIKPRSYCPACKDPIALWANVPIIGYFIVRGRCHRCGASIPVRDLIAEIALGLAALYLYLNFLPGNAVARFVFCAALMTVALIDLDCWRIPIAITIPGIFAGLLAAAVAVPETGLTNSIIGAGTGAGFLFAFSEIYRMIRGREGLGLGDVWLVGMIGAFTGWIGVIFTLFAGSLLGSICGIAYALTGRARRLPVLDSPASSERDSILLTPIPFGPFLAIAAAIFALFQPRLPDWYLFG